MKRTGPRTEPWGTPQVRGNEGELCEGIPIVDVRDERFQVNHCCETAEMPNQVESRMEWSRVSKAADRSRKQRQETCCIAMALERWSCGQSSVISVE